MYFRVIWSLSLLLLLHLIVPTVCDIYMHNPRGSNDRNCERSVNRRNGNRLFNSQNNNNGGYACPRGVGDENFQAESGDVTFSDIDTSTGETTTFVQNKRIYYYEGSILPIEFTMQHGCGGNSKIACEVVLQYACEDTLDPRVDDFWPWVDGKGDSSTTYYGKQHFRVNSTSEDHIGAPRDGVPRDSDDSATDTIPDNEASAIPSDKETRRFGMQESYDYYQVCQRTERNKGLYTADQLVRRRDRRGTRQNPNGNRHGFECPEERDYYPWWAPSPWIDIAVLTDHANDEPCYASSPQSTCSKRCQYYMNNTMNFNGKGYCDIDHSSGIVSQKLTNTKWINRQWYNNRADCETNGYVWYEVNHSQNINLHATESFVCAKTKYSRTNHLGNGRADNVISQNEARNLGVVNLNVSEGVNANRFLWTVPSIPSVNTVTHSDDQSYFGNMESAYKSCVLRIRYNISTGDFQQWPDDALTSGYPNMVDSRNNSQYEGDPRTPLAQDPYVTIGPGDSSSRGDKFVSLAVNTNQYGRTFQDRSYVFTIKPIPTADATASTQRDTPEVDFSEMATRLSNGGRIFNVNVRGKRGNIVQTYPSVEYDFIPNALALNTSDMIHWQWTGSDYNPRRGCNDAEGGPPDKNSYSTDANANKNPRADRNNVLFMDYMSNNLPKDYSGYEADSSLTHDQKVTLAEDTIMADVPCYVSHVTNAATVKTQCYDVIKRLSYLNQQSDGGSLVLRGGKECLTQEELDTLAATNRDVAEYHPLNCAKLNAKPYPYYDAGIMFMFKSGWFPFFSSRNNNFSNRQQIGVICVGESCYVDENKVLQEDSPVLAGTTNARQSASYCVDTSTGAGGESNANGASSCVGGTISDPTDPDDNVLEEETQAINEGDNDAKNEGNEVGCAIQNDYTSSALSRDELTPEEQAGLAVGLLAAGILLTWAAYWVYYRYNPRPSKDKEWLRKAGFASDAQYARTSTSDSDWSNIHQTTTVPSSTSHSNTNNGTFEMASSPGRSSASGRSASLANNASRDDAMMQKLQQQQQQNKSVLQQSKEAKRKVPGLPPPLPPKNQTQQGQGLPSVADTLASSRSSTGAKAKEQQKRKQRIDFL